MTNSTPYALHQTSRDRVTSNSQVDEHARTKDTLRGDIASDFDQHAEPHGHKYGNRGLRGYQGDAASIVFRAAEHHGEANQDPNKKNDVQIADGGQ